MAALDLTIDAASIINPARIVNSRPSKRDLPFVQAKKLLDSRHDREILEGLRSVINVCSTQALWHMTQV